MFFVIFNGLNYSKIFMGIFIRFKRCKDKKVNFWGILIWEAKVPFLDKALSRFSRSHKLIVSL